MKDGRPDQSIKFELRIKGRYPIDIEMVVKILSNGEEVIVQLLNLLVFPQMSGLSETFFTYFTPEWFFAGVGPSMNFQEM